MVTVTWVDIVLVLVILWSVATGIRSGLARVVVGFVAAIAALLAGFWFYRLVAVKLAPWIVQTSLANFAGFIIVFVGILILGSIVGRILSSIFEWVGLSWLNRALGGVAGFCRGVLLISVLVDVLVAFAPSPTPEVLQHSAVVPYVSSVSGFLIGLAPLNLRTAFEQEMDHLRRYWSQPDNNKTQIASAAFDASVENRLC